MGTYDQDGDQEMSTVISKFGCTLQLRGEFCKHCCPVTPGGISRYGMWLVTEMCKSSQVTLVCSQV